MEKNLQQSKLRLIFFVNDSRFELRNIVEFLNGQLKDLEILIVEARQYQQGASRIVVPWVFGFTEAARVAKRESKAETMNISGPAGEAAFWNAIESDASLGAGPARCEAHLRLSCRPRDQSGLEKELYHKISSIVPARTLFTVLLDTSLQLYLVNWEPSGTLVLTEKRIAARDRSFAASNPCSIRRPTNTQLSRPGSGCLKPQSS